MHVADYFGKYAVYCPPFLGMILVYTLYYDKL